jgi:hypothetical protein
MVKKSAFTAPGSYKKHGKASQVAGHRSPAPVDMDRVGIELIFPKLWESYTPEKKDTIPIALLAFAFDLGLKQ